MISAPAAIAAVALKPSLPSVNPAGGHEADSEAVRTTSAGGAESGRPRPLVDMAGIAAAQNADAPAASAGDRGTGPHADIRDQGLDEAERREVARLEKEDARVRAHESAHARTGGAFAGPPQFRFEVGPDGRRYAVSGSVSIDTQPVAGDPAATVRKMEIVKRAALAPGDPSGQDRAVAAAADRASTQARAELAAERRAENGQGGAPPPTGGAEAGIAAAAAVAPETDTDGRRSVAAFAVAADAYRAGGAVSAAASRTEHGL